MKVERTEKADAPRQAKKEPFANVLGKLAPAKGPAGTALGARAAAVGAQAARAVSKTLAAARTQSEAQANTLVSARAEGQGADDARVSERARSLIARELERTDAHPPPRPTGPQPRRDREPSSEPSPRVDATAPSSPVSGGGAADQVRPVDRAAEAMAVVERIEVLLKSGRPALAMSLSGSLAAQVQIERTGPRQVAVTLVGRNGPPGAQAVEALRAQLAQSGITLSRLELRAES